MKTTKEMVKLDENNKATNIKMPKTNFKSKYIYIFKIEKIISCSLLRRKVYFATLLLYLS